MERVRCYQLIFELFILVLFALIIPVHAANISGLKYNDFNHNGHFDPINDIDPDDQELGLPNWNISAFNESTGLLATYQLTNTQGNFLFSGLDGNSVYTVKEDLASHPGWYNMTPTEVLVDFKNASEFPPESLASGAGAQIILPTQNIAFAARSLWGNTSSYHQDLEWENPFTVQSQTRTSINPHWINNTVYNFILTYDPSNVTSPINYTVIGPPSPSGGLINYTTTSIYSAANLTSTTSPIDTIDIFTRANSGATPVRIEVSNLILTNGSASYNLVNSSIADSTISPSQTHLIIRANEVLGPGANIASQGFTLTGQQKFIYPNPVPFIDSGGFAVQINVGKNNLTPTDQVVQFANYQHIGEVEAHVFSDDNGNGIWDIVNNESQLELWTVNLYYPNNTFIASDITDEDGEYEFQEPYGDYIVKEVPQSGWLQTQGKNGYSIEINNSSFYLTDEDFGNQYQSIFNISGYKYNDLNGNGKRDPGEPGLQGWNIGVGNTSLLYYANNITDATGNYSFINVPKGVYVVNETLISGWHNTTFLNQTTCVPSFPYLPPVHLETIAGEVFYQSGGTPIGSDSAYIATKITGINPTMGYDVQNTEYPGWCGDTDITIQTSKVYDIYSFIPSYPPFPPDFVSDFPTVATTQWDKINYMLNKRSYYYSLGNDSQTFQAAIWNFTNSRPIEAAYYPFGGVSLNSAQIIRAKAIVADANANGAGYTPTCGGVEGIFLNIEQEDYGPVQLTFFEVPVRCCLPVNFGNQQLGTIIGYKNESVTGAGLSGWNITLTNSTTGYFAWNITNSSGGYNFTSVPRGTYWLNETAQAGYTQSLATPNKTVTIDGNNLTLFYNFTNTQQLGNVSGYKVNRTGTGLEGWTITLQNQTLGTPAFTNTTDSSGAFSFPNVPWGLYWLNETPQAGWAQSPLTPNRTVEINGTSLFVTTQYFNNTQQLGNVSGNKVNATSGSGLGGWTITLTNQTIGTPGYTNVTDALGTFAFPNVPWGLYWLNETPQVGWTQSQLTPNRTVEINGTSLLVTTQYFNNTQQLGNVSGNKVNATSGSGLGGWTITLTNQTLGTPALTNTTDNTGAFSFPNVPWGLYWLNETPQVGWTQSLLTPNRTIEINGTSLLVTTQYFNNTQQLGNVSGNKVNGTGAGLGGWTITLQNQTIGTPGYTNVTDASGAFGFPNVPWGLYWLNETPQVGWTQSLLTPNRTVEINGTSLLVTTQYFNNTQQLGNVSGNKVNGTGTGLGGWTITLTNQTLGTPALTNTTDNTGAFSFPNVPWGLYWLNETPQVGWTQSLLTPNRTVEINGTSLLVTTQYFNNTQQLGNVSGNKVNGTGTGLGGWTITLTNQTIGTPGYTNVTDASGAFSFQNVPWGLYWLNETPQVGWTQSLLTPNRTVEINGTSLLVTTQYFNNTQQLGNVSGNKVNGTGTGLGGWTITLKNQTLGTPAFTNITDNTGAFSFPNVPWGLYWLNETPQVGWTQSSLTPNRTIEINGTSRLVTTQYFNNTQQLGNISGDKVNYAGTGLGGWTITLQNQTLGTPVFTNTTAPNGDFSFQNVPWGLYWLNETPQAGWAQSPLTPNRTVEINGTSQFITTQYFNNTQQLGNVSGSKQDSGGIGLSGWTIVLKNQTLGTFINTTNGNGIFSFTNIPWGIYTLGEVLQPGWTQITQNRSIEINGTSLVLVNQNFTNQLSGPTFGNISGYKLKSPGLTPLGGWNITLYYKNGTLFGYRTTSGTGAFTFDPLPFGNYTLNETPQAGWTQVGPAGGSYAIQVNGSNSIVINRNFTNFQQLGNVSGYKLNSNKIGLSGWNITLSNSTIPYFTSVLTNGTGGFSFTNIPWGVFQLSEIPQPGWTQITPNRSIVINGTSLTLVNQNFTNNQNPRMGNVSGSKYNDLNGNGIKDINDVPIPGVVIKLYYQNGTLFGTRTTNANGIYVFDPVPPGVFLLNETVPSGWKQTQPSGGNYSIEVNATSVNFTRLFGNQQIPNPCSCPTNAYFTWSVVSSKPHTVQFTDATSGNPVYWYYDFGNGQFSLSRNPLITYTKGGTYTVKLSAKGCDCSGNTYWTYYSTQVKVP